MRDEELARLERFLQAPLDDLHLFLAFLALLADAFGDLLPGLLLALLGSKLGKHLV